jgi:hypothetical protein
VVETDASAAMLEEIERSNMFLVSLDPHQTWYRYHHLLRVWLPHEHQLALESEAIALLHRRHPPPVELPTHTAGCALPEIGPRLVVGETDCRLWAGRLVIVQV